MAFFAKVMIQTYRGSYDCYIVQRRSREQRYPFGGPQSQEEYDDDQGVSIDDDEQTTSIV